MANIKKKEPAPHIVFADTNILWNQSKDVPVNPEVDRFLDMHVGDFRLELVIPEVVYGELLFQHTTSALKAMEKASSALTELSSICAYSHKHRVTDAKVKRQVETKINKWIRDKGARIQPTPIQTINWTDLIQAAVWRLPPFTFDTKNSQNEKGFRDS